MKQDDVSKRYDQQPYFYNPQQQQAESAPLQQKPLQPEPSAPPYYSALQGHPQFGQPAHPGYPFQPSQPGYDAVQGYPIIETRPTDGGIHRLPCCGLGVGWFLFIIGWFLALPWYCGAIMLICTRPDPRERAGLVCCTVAAILSLIAVIVGGTTARI